MKIQNALSLALVVAASSSFAGINSANCEIDEIQVQHQSVILQCESQSSGTCNVGVWQETNSAYDEEFRKAVLAVALAAQTTGKKVMILGWTSSDGATCRIDKIRVQ